MTTTTAPAAPVLGSAPAVGTSRPDGRALAVALGIVRVTAPAPAVPPRTLQVVPGRSPLEATGWADLVGAHDAR